MDGRKFSIGRFEPRAGKQLLTVGVDCAVGKKYIALAIEREFRRRGVDADFRATGQTGVLIAGGGVVIDSVVADFVAAAAAELSPAAAPDHWDVIEGQGSLLHPIYAGVTLGLVHGSHPDAMILCADPTWQTIGDFEIYSQPDPDESIRRYAEVARLTNASTREVGVSFNKSRLTDCESRALIEQTAARHALCQLDTHRRGADRRCAHDAVKHIPQRWAAIAVQRPGTAGSKALAIGASRAGLPDSRRRAIPSNRCRARPGRPLRPWARHRQESARR